MKKIMSKDVLLSYLDFTQMFEIHTDASKHQLGACISQNGKPIAFYSQKLSPAQTRYTTTERELLAIVETLKEFRNILLGQQLRIWTDHKNLTYATYNSERVMRWRLVIEEFSPKIVYIKGEKNDAADALSQLEYDQEKDIKNFDEIKIENLAMENSKNINLNKTAMPINLKSIKKEQEKSKLLQKLVSLDKKNFSMQKFHGGELSLIVNKDGKIFIPKPLQTKIVQWYHTYLCHPGLNRTEETIRQHFYWNNLRATVQEVCGKCPTCQKTKRDSKKYGHLPPKQAESKPWQKLCVDLIGPYTIKNAFGREILIHAVTMIDPATSWFELN
jgi:cleavage and polyadenylation specificity factor subunit 1